MNVKEIVFPRMRGVYLLSELLHRYDQAEAKWDCAHAYSEAPSRSGPLLRPAVRVTCLGVGDNLQSESSESRSRIASKEYSCKTRVV